MPIRITPRDKSVGRPKALVARGLPRAFQVGQRRVMRTGNRSSACYPHRANRCWPDARRASQGLRLSTDPIVQSPPDNGNGRAPTLAIESG